MSGPKSILPHADDISDEAAAVLTEFLFQLADACETRYLAKILRHSDAKKAAQIDQWNAGRPWSREPPPTNKGTDSEP